MSDHENLDDDVVVIEQRDKKTLIYIGIAAVIGIALGGLIGRYFSATHWESEYYHLEKQYQVLNGSDETSEAKHKQKLAQLTADYEKKLAQSKTDAQQQIDALTKQLSEVKSANEKLTTQVSQQTSQLKTTQKKNTQLNRQNSLQATMFERSKQLFDKEAKVKQELASLQKEKTELVNKIADLKKECDLYLQGTSWDARSNACDLQDSSNARLGQVNQLINVREMDLKEIQNLTKELGLKDD